RVQRRAQIQAPGGQAWGYLLSNVHKFRAGESGSRFCRCNQARAEGAKIRAARMERRKWTHFPPDAAGTIKPLGGFREANFDSRTGFPEPSVAAGTQPPD